MANRNTEKDAHLQLDLALDALGPSVGAKYRVSDLWRGGQAVILSALEAKSISYTIGPDKGAGGGVGLLEIEKLSAGATAQDHGDGERLWQSDGPNTQRLLRQGRAGVQNHARQQHQVSFVLATNGHEWTRISYLCLFVCIRGQ